MRNITEQKEAEEALKESEERLRKLIEQAPEAIGITRGGLFVYLNPKHVEMFGYERPDELIGHPIIDLFAPQDRQGAGENYSRLAKGLPAAAESEFMGLRKDGSQFPFHVAVTRMELRMAPPWSASSPTSPSARGRRRHS
jgi:PAS domain S-box-containing protein